jgi:excinuclease UvrABC nuclease subunit
VKVDALTPAPTRSEPFEFRFLSDTPASSGCYALSNASGEILYVGQAKSLRSRLLQHWEDGRHNVITPYGRISRVSIVGVVDEAMLNAHERGWINQCELADGARPPLNKISAPV